MTTTVRTEEEEREAKEKLEEETAMREAKERVRKARREREG